MAWSHVGGAWLPRGMGVSPTVSREGVGRAWSVLNRRKNIAGRVSFGVAPDVRVLVGCGVGPNEPAHHDAT